MSVLEGKVEELGLVKRAQLKDLKTKYDVASLGQQTTVAAITGGMRGLTCLLTETSELHPHRGITFRGYSIEELQNALPLVNGTEQPMVEGLMWLLLTGTLPSLEEASSLSYELSSRTLIPEHTWACLDALPIDTHPMTQLCTGVLSLQSMSSFAFAYRQRTTPKKDLWKPLLQDAVSMLAKVPVVAAYIYRRTFKNGEFIPPRDDLDWAANYAHMMGFDSPDHFDLMRLLLMLLADHEGGNVSAHASTLVGSAMTDPYLAYSAGMAGLSGPLHGLANQECLNWLLDVQMKLMGQTPTKENITDIAKKTLQAGNIIPGYGHAVLRTTDPRYTAQRRFALKKLPDAKLFKLLEVCYETIPDILKATGKVNNPYPNVDCHTGVLLQHYGITQSNYYTVMFGVARAVGVTSQLVWCRLLGLPIERPKSITLDGLTKMAEAQQTQQHK
eukprot:GHVS01064744.1.p1 GENE.GHVS01064744.1~~GHVS01064744.1.p1  ORF type:complete len:514 (-),score=52.29 GHVS01064744.1:259-1590(-)